MRFPTSTTLKLALSSSALVLLAGALSCGSSSSSFSSGSTSPLLTLAPVTATLIYAQLDETIVGYSTSASGSVTPVVTLNLPSNTLIQGLTTDKYGQLFVTAYTSAGNHEILVYAPGANGDATPSRTILVSSTSMPKQIAISPTSGEIYVGSSNTINSQTTSYVSVYPSSASGTTVPSRIITLAVPGNNYIDDISVDAAGNVYVLRDGDTDAQYTSRNGLYIFYPTDLVPSRSISFAAPGVTYGAAAMTVNANGNVYALLGGNEQNYFEIGEFDATASGLSTPMNTVLLPAPPANAGQTYVLGDMHVDGIGNMYTAIQISCTGVPQCPGIPPSSPNPTYLYGYAAGATGAATPIVNQTIWSYISSLSPN